MTKTRGHLLSATVSPTFMSKYEAAYIDISNESSSNQMASDKALEKIYRLPSSPVRSILRDRKSTFKKKKKGGGREREDEIDGSHAKTWLFITQQHLWGSVRPST